MRFASKKRLLLVTREVPAGVLPDFPKGVVAHRSTVKDALSKFLPQDLEEIWIIVGGSEGYTEKTYEDYKAMAQDYGIPKNNVKVFHNLSELLDEFRQEFNSNGGSDSGSEDHKSTKPSHEQLQAAAELIFETSFVSTEYEFSKARHVGQLTDSVIGEFPKSDRIDKPYVRSLLNKVIKVRYGNEGVNSDPQPSPEAGLGQVLVLDPEQDPELAPELDIPSLPSQPDPQPHSNESELDEEAILQQIGSEEQPAGSEDDGLNTDEFSRKDDDVNNTSNSLRAWLKQKAPEGKFPEGTTLESLRQDAKRDGLGYLTDRQLKKGCSNAHIPTVGLGGGGVQVRRRGRRRMQVGAAQTKQPAASKTSGGKKVGKVSIASVLRKLSEGKGKFPTRMKMQDIKDVLAEAGLPGVSDKSIRANCGVLKISVAGLGSNPESSQTPAKRAAKKNIATKKRAVKKRAIKAKKKATKKGVKKTAKKEVDFFAASTRAQIGRDFQKFLVLMKDIEAYQAEGLRLREEAGKLSHLMGTVSQLGPQVQDALKQLEIE